MIIKLALPVSLSSILSRKRARRRTNRYASFTLKIGAVLAAMVSSGLVLALAACGEKPQASAPQPAPAKLYQQERDALEKAKGVEQTQAKSEEDLKREVEKQAQ